MVNPTIGLQVFKRYNGKWPHLFCYVHGEGKRT